MVRISGMEEKLLLFNVREEKLKSIIALCRIRGVIPVVITSDESNRELGELAGFHKEIAGAQAGAPAAFTDEMMVFSMVEDLDGFLEDYRRMGIPPVPLKAVLTPYNMKWTPAQLCTELVREREAFRKMNGE